MVLVESQRGEVQPRRGLELDDSPETEIDAGNVHPKVLDECIPKVGMVFETEEDAYKFYNFYAKNVGFSIKRSKAHKDKQTKKVFDRTFCCSCEGQRKKDKRDAEVKCHRPETRCGCKAMMKVNSRKTGKYEVISFMAEHNHELATPTKSHFLRIRSHSGMSGVQEALADLAENSGINQKDSYELKRGTKNAKTGNLGITVESPTNDDPKARMAMRYRDLCQLYTRLVTRASESDEAYKLAKEGFLKLLEEVDATFADKVIEEPTPEFSDILNVSEDTRVQLKGIKEKGKGTCTSSMRPRGALERAVQSKKKRISKQNFSENVEGESTVKQASHVIERE